MLISYFLLLLRLSLPWYLGDLILGQISLPSLGRRNIFNMSATPSPPHSDDVEKHNEMRKESLHDHEILGNTNVTREDAMHMGALTEEEEVIARKLRIKIDMLIMPLVILVCKERSLAIVKSNADR